MMLFHVCGWSSVAVQAAVQAGVQAGVQALAASKNREPPLRIFLERLKPVLQRYISGGSQSFP